MVVEEGAVQASVEAPACLPGTWDRSMTWNECCEREATPELGSRAAYEGERATKEERAACRGVLSATLLLLGTSSPFVSYGAAAEAKKRDGRCGQRGAAEGPVQERAVLLRSIRIYHSTLLLTGAA